MIYAPGVATRLGDEMTLLTDLTKNLTSKDLTPWHRQQPMPEAAPKPFNGLRGFGCTKTVQLFQVDGLHKGDLFSITKFPARSSQSRPTSLRTDFDHKFDNQI